jgi:hypothetical protein
MDVIENTLALGPYVACFQDILLHGQDIRNIKREIGEIKASSTSRNAPNTNGAQAKTADLNWEEGAFCGSKPSRSQGKR